MDDRYLWDGSGPPDREIARLEEALAPLRLPEDAPPTKPRREAVRRRRRWLAAAGGGLSLAAAAALALWFSGRATAPAGGQVTTSAPAASAPAGAGPASADQAPAWRISALAGAPRVADVPLRADTNASSGAVIETDKHSRARISIGDIGQVDLEAGSRARLVSAGQARHRLGLDRGVMHALIWAPPGRFDVETSAGVATDLGCSYTLSVDGRGRGLVSVTSGWVGFEYQGREALIPAGASATLRDGQGPGTPTVPGSPAALRALIDQVDDQRATSDRLLTPALAAARGEDAVTLWHLLARLPPTLRGPVHDRLAQLAPPPASVTRPGIVAGDASMRDSWWDQLGHGPIAHWRRWKASTPPGAQ